MKSLKGFKEGKDEGRKGYRKGSDVRKEAM
jgi:hypothetical protein